MKNRKTKGNEQNAVSRTTEESDEARGIRESIEEMERELDTFTAGAVQTDDITALVVRVNGDST